MGYNRFALNIIIRSLLITGNAILIALLLQNRNWIFTFIFFCFVLILQVYLFIRYTGRVNRDLANFLIHIKEQDTTMVFASNSLDKTFKGLSREFQRINKEFQKVKSEQIQKQHLLNLLLDRVGTGILIVNNNFETELLNKAFTRMFDIESEQKNIWQKIESYLPDIKKLRAGEQRIETIHVNSLNRKILISLSEVHENSGILKIFSFHDIDREITDYELQSWNGLIKVVSHEIMNTITPMSTVVETIKDCHTINNIEKETHQLTKKDIYDTIKSINLLENRLNSLKNFISRFRLFSDIPSPDLKMFELNGYLKFYIELYRKNHPTIQFNFKTETEKIIIHADSDLLGLVLNNLIKNAAESLTNNPNPRIDFKTGKNNETVFIDISDNGLGIEPGLIKKVFMPFFTTKKEGSGIGLSISRQIMFLQNGTIELKSDKTGTSVRLLFIQKESS